MENRKSNEDNFDNYFLNSENFKYIFYEMQQHSFHSISTVSKSSCLFGVYLQPDINVNVGYLKGK